MGFPLVSSRVNEDEELRKFAGASPSLPITAIGGPVFFLFVKKSVMPNGYWSYR
jgi:hypothetical protein